MLRTMLVVTFAVIAVACDKNSVSKAVTDASSLVGAHDAAVTADPAAAHRIARENTLSGSPDWLLAHPALAGEIEGYAMLVSQAAGEPVPVAVSMSPAGHFSYRVYRLGYYGGARGRLLADGGPLPGTTQAAPTFDTATGLIEAHWKASFEIATRDQGGTAWPSGAYLVVLAREGGPQSYAVFVLRDDSRDAEVALELSTATWQAYNAWGGDSLYESAHGLSGNKARKVSYDRPYEPDLGYGSGLLISQELPAIAWLEQHGYDVEYTTNLDTGGHGGRIGAHRLHLAVGHDEYATLEAMDRAKAALGHGTSLAFLSGNTRYWQVRYEDSAAGKDRVEVCYKDRTEEDPALGVDNAHLSTKFREPPVSRPENALIGIMSDGSSIESPTDWVVANANHWVYGGTNVADGDHIPGVVGYEWDSVVNNGATPADLTVLASSPVAGNQGPRTHNAAVYERGGSFVFAAGSIYFDRGLTDPRVSRMLANVLARAGAKTYQP